MFVIRERTYAHPVLCRKIKLLDDTSAGSRTDLLKV